VSNSETAIPLSKRERQVLEMVATGASNQQIASQLVISVNTVKVHLRNVFEKLGVQSRTEAILRAIQEGWIVVDDAAGLDDAAASPRTYLNGQQLPLLATWQQFYLGLAVLLALGLMIVPLIPKSLPQTGTPALPVIYAQAPTPVPATTNSTTWDAHTPMPTQRAGLGLVAFDGRIFAIGGVRGNNQATRLVEIYDPSADSWSEGAAKPTATADVTGVVLDDKVYVPGGCTNEGQASKALDIYDPTTDDWEQGPAMPAARCGYGLVAFDDKLYLFGGWNGRGFADTIFVFSPEANRWDVLDGTLPGPKGFVGAAVLNDTIYIAGGFDGDNEYNQTYVFEPETGAWIEKSPLNEKRGGLKLISTGHNLYAIGGGYAQTTAGNEKYDPATDTWTSFDSPVTHQWRNMGLAAIDTTIYAIGGWDGSDEKYMDTVVSYQTVFQLFLPITTNEQR
jgi:DNA-binding CsgD family transcriptional regulator/N-acetylneuraminic acid mutarotase